MLCGLFARKPRTVDSLDHSHENLLDVPPDVYLHRHTLQRLYLNSNHIRDVPKGLSRFELLEDLDLSENDVVFLPPSIGQLLYLKQLNISKNGLTNIPEAIQHCQELVSANFATNPIGRLPEGLTLAHQLKHLYLNECELDQLPPNFGRLCRLENLELRENHLMNLPSSLSHLILLERLDVGINELEELPGVIGHLESLVELWADSNPLTILPSELGQLTNLRFLELSECRIESVPDTIGGLVNLTDLYLQDNMITELPDSFGMLQKLVTCRLDTNRLTKLPESIGGLQSLSEFNISYNHITELPQSIGSIIRLRTLMVDENLLYVLPDEIGSCVSLTLLSVRNNKLIELPSSIGQLVNLTIMNVVGNRLQELPITVRSMRSLAALWITENQGRPMVDLQVESDQHDEHWLTCVLFPQTGPQSAFDGSGSASQSDSSMVRIDQPEKPTLVNFDPLVPEKKVTKVMREPTPYHKDLHSKVKQWRVTRDVATDTTNSGAVKPRKMKRKAKLERPQSLLNALCNPVQDEDAAIDVMPPDPSPDLILPTLTVTSPSTMDELSCPSSPDIHPLPDPIILNSNNSNNNNSVVVQTLKEEEHHDGVDQKQRYDSQEQQQLMVQAAHQRYSSMESGFEADTEQDPALTPAAPPAWYLQSSSCSPCHPPVSVTSLTDKSSEPSTVCLSPHRPQTPPPTVSPHTRHYSPDHAHTNIPSLNLDSAHSNHVPLPPPIVVSPSFSSSISSQTTASDWSDQPLSSYRPRPHYYHSNVRQYLPPKPARPDHHYQPVVHQSIGKPLPRQHHVAEQEFAMEHTLQSCQRPQFVMSDEGGLHHPLSRPSSQLQNKMVRRTERYVSDDSNYGSGVDTPECFHHTHSKSYVSVGSCNDSGTETAFHRSASTGMILSRPHSPLVKMFKVVLSKNPTLGLGITGGIDGENAIVPGDKSFRVYKLVKGLPADQCGKIRQGDKILEVNGVDVSNLKTAQLVHLLTSPAAGDGSVTILLSRQETITLL